MSAADLKGEWSRPEYGLSQGPTAASEPERNHHAVQAVAAQVAHHTDSSAKTGVEKDAETETGKK